MTPMPSDQHVEYPTESLTFFERLWRIRIVRIFVVLAVLSGIGWTCAWAAKKVERRQSRKLVAMATEYFKEGKIEEARMGLEAALRLNPANAEALRMLARFRLAQGANAEALDAMRRLTESGQLSFADISSYAVLAAREGDSALADRLVNVAASGGNPVLSHILRAQVSEAKNDPAGAEKELREAVAADESGEAGLLLARFLISSRRNSQTAPEVLEILRRTSGSKDAWGAESLALGLSSGVVPPTEWEGWISSLRSHPQVGAPGLLLADASEIRLKPATKADVMARMATRLQGKPVGDRVQGMALAMQVGEPQAASSLINAAEAAGDVRVLAMWLDALAMQNRWPEILEMLKREGVPLPEFLKGLYSGRALIAMGKTAEGTHAYGTALEGAFAKRQDFIIAVAYLGRVGADDLFEQGLRKALEDPQGRAEVLQAVVPAVAGRQDAARTRRVYEIAASMPQSGEDLVLRNDLDYLSLVLGQPVDIQILAERSRANPRDFALRMTYALALVKAGNAKQALEVLDQCEPDVYVEILPPHHKVVVAAAMALSGRMNEARRVAMMIPAGSLSKQEGEFLIACLESGKSTAEPVINLEKKTKPKK